MLAAEALLAFRRDERDAQGRTTQDAFVGAMLLAEHFEVVRAVYRGLGGR